MKYERIRNFINGRFETIQSDRVLTITSPGDGTQLAELPCSTAAALDEAVKAAKAAFPTWSKT